ncbi:MAG TPA: DNA topoisomerase IB [Actinomycetota bacterium]|nr:DNA topoisomerase IB [Actinomycetota bacterium]
MGRPSKAETEEASEALAAALSQTPDRGDPQGCADVVGLRYVTDAMPGITRRRSGKGFSYRGPDGRPVREPGELARFRALAIPPAWTEVWICPDPDGHLQATGRDQRGRKQYRYHPLWRQVRDQAKYGEMVAFGSALPRIRARVQRDLSRPGLGREKVLATIVRLLDTTGLRIGNEEYARENDSYGLTTLRDSHALIGQGRVTFRFRGKSGRQASVQVADRRLARIVKACRDIPGQELFQYLDEAGEAKVVGSGDVNDYLREISGQAFTAKDFRTWAGTVSAACALREMGHAETQTEAKRRVVRAVEAVAGDLGNTPAVARKCYVHPGVIESYLAGTLDDVWGRPAEGRKQPRKTKGLSADEEFVLALLKRARRQARRAAA